MNSYEDKRQKSDQTIKHYVDAHLGGSTTEIDLQNEDHIKVIKQSILFANEDWKDDQIELIDCRSLKDPFKSRNLRDHVGFHPEILEMVSEDIRLWRLFPNTRFAVISTSTGKVLRLVFMDSRGRQRSPAVAWLAVSVFHQEGIDMEVQYTYTVHPGGTCAGNCDACRHTHDTAKGIAMKSQVRALDSWDSLENESTSVTDPDSPVEAAPVADVAASSSAGDAVSAPTGATASTAKSLPVRVKKSLPKAKEKTAASKPRGSVKDEVDPSPNPDDLIDYASYSDHTKYLVIRRLLAVFSPGKEVYSIAHKTYNGVDDALVKLQAAYKLDTTVIVGMLETDQQKAPEGSGSSGSDARRAPAPPKLDKNVMDLLRHARSRSPAPPRRARPDVASPKRPREKGTESKGAAGHRSSSGPHASGAAVAKPAVSTNVVKGAPVPWMTQDARNRQASRDKHVKALVANTKFTGDDKIDTDPLDISDAVLTSLLTGRKKNFIAYWGGAPGDDAKYKVRINGKFRPGDTKISHPPEMKGMKKTTLVRAIGSGSWTVFEDRVDIDHTTVVGGDIDIQEMLIFCQPPRADKSGIAYFAHAPDPTDLSQAVAMTKSQRGRYNEGLDNLDKQDEAYGSALGLPMYSSARGDDDDVLVVTDDIRCARQYKNTLHLTRTLEFVDHMLGHFAKTKPLIVVSAWFGSILHEDPLFVIEYFAALQAFMDAGRVVIHLEAQFPHNLHDSLVDCRVTHCRGDLSFFTNSKYMENNMVTWSWCRNNSFAPNTIRDVLDDPFGETLRGALRDASADLKAYMAFPAEMQEEGVDDEEFLDHPSGGEADDHVPLDKNMRETLDRGRRARCDAPSRDP